MRFGICCNVVSAVVAERAGADFFEPTVINVLSPDKDSPPEAIKELAHTAIKPEAFNMFFSQETKLVGPDVDPKGLEIYARRTFERAASVGGRVLVLGSGGARMAPDGFGCDEALRQLRAFLAMAAPLAAESGIVIAIEPLSKTECNLLNTVAEAKALAASLNHPNVSVVADIYHMAAAGETFDVLSDAGRTIAHVHVAQPGDRSQPKPNGYDWRPFMKALKSGGYDNRISIESMWSDFSAEAPDAVKVIRAAWEQA